MKILVFGASNSKNSINKKFATYASSFFEGADVHILDLNDVAMPLFSVDLEANEGHPQAAHRFLQHIESSDLLIVSMAEHNGSYTAAFKNTLDWASRIKSGVFQEKAMLLLSTSPGKRGGKGVMDAAKVRFPIHTAHILATFSLPEFYVNFDDERGITNEELLDQFLESVNLVKNHF